MAFAGCAAKEFSIVPRARTEVGLVSTSRLAALAAGPAPAGFLPRLARKGHAFSERANRHGFFGDGSMWAVSERERSGASKQRKLRARADQQLVSFKRESRRARALERELADRERWMTELLAMKNAAVLVQVRYRIFAARRKVDLRRQLFNSKFLVRLMKYRMHKKRVLRATQRIKIACKFFNAKRDAALRLLREEAASRNVDVLFAMCQTDPSTKKRGLAYAGKAVESVERGFEGAPASLPDALRTAALFVEQKISSEGFGAKFADRGGMRYSELRPQTSRKTVLPAILHFLS